MRRAAALGACLLALGAAAPAVAAPAAPEPAALALQYAGAWPPLQDGAGRFRDYAHPGASGRYSEAVLGDALLELGLAERRDLLVASGLRGIGAALGSRWPTTSVFEVHALASAYNLARARMPADPRFRDLRPRWEAFLRAVPPVLLGRRLPFHNHHVVEAAAWVELTATGLRSARPGAVLFDPAGARRTATAFLLRRAPAAARFRGTRVARRPASLLSDAPSNHPAYHPLSLAYYGRAVERLGPRPPARAIRTLVRGARASWALTAPDGDVAYWGRSQEHSWALAFTAYTARLAAGLTSSSEARRMRALADRALRRLRSMHALLPGLGLAMTPAISRDLLPGIATTESYADAAAFNGLTLLGLRWAAQEPGGGRRGVLGADRRLAVVLRAGVGDFAVVRSGPVWFAVRRTIDPRCTLRCDFGLVAFKEKAPWGGFADVMRLRPRRSADGAGPVLLGRRRRPARGQRIRARGRQVTVLGRLGRRAVRFTWRAQGCGVRLAWPARRGDRYEYSVFFAERPRRVGRAAIRGGGQLVRASHPFAIRLENGYSSALDPVMFRARLRLRAAGGPVRIDHCR